MLSKLCAALVATAFVFSVAPTLAQSSMSAYFENTLVMTMADGGEIRMYINEDNTYSGTTPDGTEFGGVWELKGGQTCFTRQPATHAPTCEDYAGKSVGDSWQGEINAGGAEVTVELVAGR